MNKQTKRLLAILLIAALVFLPFSTKLENVKAAEDFDRTPVFSNSFFDHTLSNPTQAVEEYVRFIDVFNKIDYYMQQSVQGESVTTKNNRDATIVNEINTLVNNKRVSITTPDELYYLSAAASYNYVNVASVNAYAYKNTIKKVLDLDYVLLNDIDYASMGARTFIPLGVSIPSQDISMPFTGTFDGNGFTISNLYFADYDYITAIFQVGDISTRTEVGTFEYYAMFAHIDTTGIIKNFVLKNPIFELLDAPTSLYRAAMLAGSNKGKIHNVAVIDEKKTNNVDNSGIRFRLQYIPSSDVTYTAAGFVHTNHGEITNSFIVSDNVIATGDGRSKFTVKPFVYYNNHTNLNEEDVDQLGLKGLSYNNELDASSNLAQNKTEIKNYTKQDIKTGLINSNTLPNINAVNTKKIDSIRGVDDLPDDPTATNLNFININLHDGNPIISAYDRTLYWYNMHKDGYPQLLNIEFDKTKEEIVLDDAFDIMMMSKLISSSSDFYGKAFNAQTYYIKNDINMINFNNYKTPSREFTGKLYGGTDVLNDNQNQNSFIFNMTIKNPSVVGSNYYLGFLGSVSTTGIVEKINFYNSTITVTNSRPNYGRTFFIGFVSDSRGRISDVISNANIVLGTNAIGQSYVGGIAGRASGIVENVANKGVVNAKYNEDISQFEPTKHNFEGLQINANYYIGGIIGSNNTQELKLTNALNEGDVFGIGSINSNYSSINDVNIYVGGIAGEIYNYTVNGNSIIKVTNRATITSNAFVGKSTTKVNQFVGGIFGSVRGRGFKNSQAVNNVEVLRNGRFENNGVIKGEYVNDYTYLFAAGITTMNTNFQEASISYLINNPVTVSGVGDSEIRTPITKNIMNDFTNMDYKTLNGQIFYASTVIDNSEEGIVLSRAYNMEDYVIPSSFFHSNSVRLNEPDEIKISFFFVSTKDKNAKLIYVENLGDLTIGQNNEVSTVAKMLKISNITQAANVDFEKVINSGDIHLVSILNEDNIYVAGFTWILSNLEKERYIMDSFNEGNIVTTGISGNTMINQTSGHSSIATTYAGTLIARNLYVAGIVNINVGKIQNVMNLGDITSYHDDYSNQHITGRANSYVGGISTFNYNLIRDVANTGEIIYYNTYSGTLTSAENDTNNVNRANYSIYVAGGTNPNSQATYGGMIYLHRNGLTLGGIVAALGDTTALILEGYIKKENGNPIDLTPQILDSANSGTIFGKAQSYVRAAGILGVSLGTELASGTYSASKGSIRGTFGTSESDHSVNNSDSKDRVAKSILSNGLNFGDVYAFTREIGQYSSFVNTANGQRPGIYAAAGGVIGYGLSNMTNMLNHGDVASTDVAGGVVGATYIFGGATTSGRAIYTRVDISTAAHYGRVKALKKDQTSFTYENRKNYNSSYYYIDGDTTFIFRNSGSNDLSTHPAQKRGFGGIFGRLQRGFRGAMISTNFSNIMNMDPNIDMIGRADAEGYTGNGFYRFYSLDEFGNLKPDLYYTARAQDTSPSKVVSYVTRRNPKYRTYTYAPQVTFRVTRTNDDFTVNSITVSNANGYDKQEFIRNVTLITSTNGSTTNQSYYQTLYFKGVSETISIPTGSQALSNFPVTQSELLAQNVPDNGTYTKNFTVETFQEFTVLKENGSSTAWNYYERYRIEKITDQGYLDGYSYIFDENFPLMDPAISDQIYNANRDVLADIFKEGGDREKPQGGMYVLATQAGRTNGAVLPLNIKLDRLLRIDESNEEYLNVFDVPYQKLIRSYPSESVPIETWTREEVSLKNIENARAEMYQVLFNDKSYLFPDGTNSSLADLTLYDPNGNYPTLSGGIYNENTNTITFKVSASAFASMVDLYYEVESVTLSENAVVAKNGIDDTRFTNFKNAYKDHRMGHIITNDMKWTTPNDVDIVNGSASFELTVYSEASAQELFMLYYKTVYNIVIEVEPSIEEDAHLYLNESPTEANLTFNHDNKVYTSTDSINADGSLRMTFSSEYLPINHKMHVYGIYVYDENDPNKKGEEIPQEFYTLSYIPKVNVNSPSAFRIVFSPKLAQMTYVIEYGYYLNADVFQLHINKAPSTKHSVLSVEYDTYSSDFEGLSTTFAETDTSFTTYMAFGNIFEGVTKNSVDLQVRIIPTEEDVLYLNNTIGYELYLDNSNEDEWIVRLSISPFAELNGATISYDFNNGKREYYITYEITSEVGIEADTIVHTIAERNIGSKVIYKNDNIQVSNSLFVYREDDVTRIDIEWDFIDSSMYHDIFIEVDGSTVYDLEIFYTSSSNNFFTVYVTNKLDLGSETMMPKTITLKLDRGDGITYNLKEIDDEITVTMVRGSDAYMKNIQFQTNTGITISYPQITSYDYVNGSLVPLTDLAYQVRANLFGIDYASTIDAGYHHFRIDGILSDLPLMYYAPNFTIPLGAKIQRLIDGQTNILDNNNWTDELETNFIGTEAQEKIVTYRIVSEDGTKIVYYYITAEDIKYNLTLQFEVYFRKADGTIVDANSDESLIKNKVILISIKNLMLSETPEEIDFGNDNYGYDYPVVLDDIIGINNQATMFYFPGLGIIYNFGRNMSGAYNFSLVTPIYTGPTTDNMVAGERFNYTIYLNTSIDTIDTWTQERLDNFELPLLGGEYIGRYYYVLNPTGRPFSRKFAIVIESETSSGGWGLHDETTSWDNIN